MRLYSSIGRLKYDVGEFGYKLILEVDPELVNYYRSLVPKWIKINRQMYAPHISVVRKEIPPNLNEWGKHEGREVEFAYANIVYNGTIYYWLNAFSGRLEKIRQELGLPVTSEYTRPPDGWIKCFHITIGNRKGL